MKRKYFRTLYNRAVSLTVAFSLVASLCLVSSVIPTAGAEETEGTENAGEPHVHTFACYENYELDCGENHSKEEHRERCYTHSGELVCGLEEGELHDHEAFGCEVAARILVCGEDEVLEDEADLILGEDEEEESEEDEPDDAEEENTVKSDGSTSVNGNASASGNTSAGKTDSDESENPDGMNAPGMSGEGSVGSGETEAAGDNISREEESKDSGNLEEDKEDAADSKTENDDNNSGGSGDSTNDGEGDHENEAGTDINGDGSGSGTEGSDGEDGSGAETGGNGAEADGSSTNGTGDGSGQGGNTAGGSAGAEGNSAAGGTGTEENSAGGAVDGGAASFGGADQGIHTVNTDDGKQYALFTAGRLMQGRVYVRGIDVQSWFMADDIIAASAMAGDGDGETVEPEADAGETDEEKIDAKGTSEEKIDAEGTSEEKIDAEGTSEEKIDAEETDEEKADAEGTSEEKIDAEETNVEKIDAEETNAEKIGTEETDAEGTGGKEADEAGTDAKEARAEEVASPSNADAIADEEKVHKHSEDCYATVYKCRGIMPVALLNGNIHNQTELENAIQNGTDIIIANDFSINSTIVIGSGRSAVIDLNGCTLTYGGSADTPMFRVPANGELTIRDSMSGSRNVSPVKNRVVDTPGETVYNPATKKLTYYVTECEVNLDRRSTTNTTWEYVLDLDSSGVGTLDGKGIGSVISVEGGIFTIRSGRIRNTKDSGDDGWYGIFMSGGTTNVEGGYIVDCGANQKNGGGISTTAGWVSVSGGVIANNRGQQGGGIFATGTGGNVTVNISGGTIANNTAVSYNAGGVYGSNAAIAISGGSIIGNVAKENGGGILSTGSTGVITATGGQIAGNKAGKNGGGIYVYQTTDSSTISDVVIANNVSQNAGGGIYTNRALTLNASTKIVGNIAKADNGGGVYNDSAGLKKITIEGKSVIAANTASNTGSNSIYPYPYQDHTASFLISEKAEDDCYVEGVWKSGDVREVKTAEELKTEITNASAGQFDITEICLGADIELADENPVAIAGKNIVLDLKGHNITGTSVNTTGLFSVTGKNGSLTVKDSAAGQDPAPQPLSINADLPLEAGKQGTYENHVLTYYVTESEPASDGIHTVESTYQYTINPRLNGRTVGTINGAGKNTVLSASDNARIVIEGGIITNPGGKHGVSLENKSALSMKGGYILGSGADDGSTGNDYVTGGGGVMAVNSGVEVTGGVIAANRAPRDGGGVMVKNENNSVVRIMGGVIAGNVAGNRGGGLHIEGGSAEIGGDAVIASNFAHAQPRTADGRPDKNGVSAWSGKDNFHGGGGVFFEGDVLTIKDQCHITHNSMDKWDFELIGNGGTGGGGVFARGRLNLAGGYVTANLSEAAGGGVYSHSQPSYPGVLNVTGGIIAGNYAVHDEGGGVRTDGRGGSIDGSKIYITNNRTDTVEAWGGGGIFVMSSAELNIKNVLITENEAEGFGGGVGGCNHGMNRVFSLNGGAIYGNQANGRGEKLNGYQNQALPKKDHRNHADRIDAKTPVIEEDRETAFIDYAYDGGKKSYQDFYCSNISQVYDRMLGGGSANWHGSYSNSSKTDAENLPVAYPLAVGREEPASASNLMGLNANPSPADIAKAESAANIFITGNQSASNGGGVMNNGTFGIGDNPGGTAGLTIKKEVGLADGTRISSDEIFTFRVTWRNENGEEMNETDENGQPLAYPVVFEPAYSENARQTSIVYGGTFTLRAGQSVTIKNLPIGEYEVEEQGGDQYVKFPNHGIANGPIWKNDESEVIFRNVPKSKLKIQKMIYDAGSPIPAGDPRESDEFRFVITFADGDGEMITGNYPYTRNDQEFSNTDPENTKYPTLGSGDEFVLRHKESITIHDLPAGAHYTIEERKAPGYQTAAKKTGIIENRETVSYVEIRNVPGDDPNTPTDPSPTDPAPTHPGDNGGGGGGGGGGSSEPTPSDPTEPAPSESGPSPETPAEGAEPEQPQYPEELPDPNDPDSPERVTILENGVPRTYLKVWDPETQEFMYIPEDEIPLGFMLPPAGDGFRRILWMILCGISLSGAVLLVWERRKKDG